MQRKNSGTIPEISGIGVLAAFLAGATSFLSPCVLPLVPGYVSYIAGQPDLAAQRRAGLVVRIPAAGPAAGLGVPFPLAARLKAIGRAGQILYKAAGGVMVPMGFAIMTGYLSAFAWWLLGTFPVLGNIG